MLQRMSEATEPPRWVCSSASPSPARIIARVYASPAAGPSGSRRARRRPAGTQTAARLVSPGEPESPRDQRDEPLPDRLRHRRGPRDDPRDLVGLGQRGIDRARDRTRVRLRLLADARPAAPGRNGARYRDRDCARGRHVLDRDHGGRGQRRPARLARRTRRRARRRALLDLARDLPRSRVGADVPREPRAHPAGERPRTRARGARRPLANVSCSRSGRGAAAFRDLRAAGIRASADSGLAPRVWKWREDRLDLGAQVLERRREDELFAEVLRILVEGEAWAEGRDLEEDPVRLAEIDRAEPEPIDNRRRVR